MFFSHDGIQIGGTKMSYPWHRSYSAILSPHTDQAHMVYQHLSETMERWY